MDLFFVHIKRHIRVLFGRISQCAASASSLALALRPSMIEYHVSNSKHGFTKPGVEGDTTNTRKRHQTKSCRTCKSRKERKKHSTMPCYRDKCLSTKEPARWTSRRHSKDLGVTRRVKGNLATMKERAGVRTDGWYV